MKASLFSFGSFCIALLVATMLLTGFSGDGQVTGRARVLDGDTIVVGDQKVRLAHIDAAEMKQDCKKKATGEVYPCGEEARYALEWLIEGTVVSCNKGKFDLYKRLLAVCFVDKTDINKYMISTGNAVLYQRDKTYIKEQEDAKLKQSGMWASEFEWPWEWRKNKKLSSKLKKEQAKAAKAAKSDAKTSKSRSK